MTNKNRNKDKNAQPQTPNTHGGQSTNDFSNFFNDSTIVPNFLILHSEEEKRLSEISPFLVSKALLGIAGSVKSVKKLNSGDLLVCTANEAQSKNLLKTTHLAHLKISVKPHPTLNFSKGVIYCPDIMDLSESEILDGLRDQNVHELKQITSRKNDSVKKTPLFILTFSTPILPEKLNVGYLNIKVRPYIPNPIRCFRCQTFGHGVTTCRGSLVCAKCGQPDHSSDICTAEKPHCKNCSQDHEASSKLCSKWQVEKEIQRLKVLFKLSHADAKKQAMSILPPRANESYATVTKTTPPSQKPKFKSTGCQTISIDSPKPSDPTTLPSTSKVINSQPIDKNNQNQSIIPENTKNNEVINEIQQPQNTPETEDPMQIDEINNAKKRLYSEAIGEASRKPPAPPEPSGIGRMSRMGKTDCETAALKKYRSQSQSQSRLLNRQIYSGKLIPLKKQEQSKGDTTPKS